MTETELLSVEQSTSNRGARTVMAAVVAFLSLAVVVPAVAGALDGQSQAGPYDAAVAAACRVPSGPPAWSTDFVSLGKTEELMTSEVTACRVVLWRLGYLIELVSSCRRSAGDAVWNPDWANIPATSEQLSAEVQSCRKVIWTVAYLMEVRRACSRRATPNWNPDWVNIGLSQDRLITAVDECRHPGRRRKPTPSAATPTTAVVAGPTAAAPTAQFANCTALRQVYPHGVGRADAVDNGGVTTFRRDTALYNAATSYNGDLDRDGDGVACEQK